MTEQEEKLMQERVLEHHEREQDAETRYRKLKEFLSINGYNVGHLLRLDEGKLLIEHAEACRDSFKICMKNRDNEITDLKSRLAEAQARAERAEGCVVKHRIMLEGARCPNCDGSGVYVQANPRTGEPGRAQCEWCYYRQEILLTPAPQGRTDGEREKAGFYMGKWYALDNFSPFSVVYEGRVYPTAEHLYQALKFEEPELREAVRNAQSAHAAKKLARSMPEHYRPKWDKHKTAIMITVCSLKMVQHEYVQKTLLKSGDMEIVETSPVDSFWGCGRDGQGRNELGKIWMRLRDRLRNADATAPEVKGGAA
jgi:ribA/ribD-fused uncharacterized protein